MADALNWPRLALNWRFSSILYTKGAKEAYKTASHPVRESKTPARAS